MKYEVTAGRLFRVKMEKRFHEVGRHSLMQLG